MKIRLFIIAALFALGILSVACTQKACPAYTTIPTETIPEIG